MESFLCWCVFSCCCLIGFFLCAGGKALSGSRFPGHDSCRGGQEGWQSCYFLVPAVVRLHVTNLAPSWGLPSTCCGSLECLGA